MTSVNPANGEKIRDYQPTSASAVASRLSLAQEAFLAWRDISFSERAGLLRKTASELRKGVSEFAKLITEEMGKPIAQSEAEIEKCAWCCEFYAEHAAAFLAEEAVATDASYSGIRYDPIGAVLAVMPWNFPFWQVFRFAAPALMAGNVALLKHASNVPGCSLAIEEVFRRAGLPIGCFTSLLVDNSAVAPVIRHPIIKAVTLTGSEGAGKAIAAEAGAQIKKTVLELGGSDPFIVLKDAHLDSAVQGAVFGRTQNSGQSCISAKRFLVHDSLYEEFCYGLSFAFAELRIGDPMDRSNNIGPMAREDLLETLHSQVERSVAQGATLIAGGKRLDGRGYFYQPTILGDVTPGMSAFDEETFGPLAAVIKADDEEHAIELANRSNYGLGASIWCGDTARAHEMAKRIEAGSVFINDVVKSDPRLPFGGVKLSGYGRELSKEGIREFTNIKSVWVK